MPARKRAKERDREIRRAAKAIRAGRTRVMTPDEIWQDREGHESGKACCSCDKCCICGRWKEN